ncbi:DUF2779 domain-containing protein [bacterium SCSIO 12741]|nr:DUF2779 domain-containing protein [bacterium SCSIO 12741]
MDTKLDFTRVISKTSFARGWQCEKFLWLHKYQSELKEERDSPEGKILKELGNPVFEWFKKRYPEGKSCGKFGERDEEKDWLGSIELTRQLLDQGEKALFYPSFLVDDLMCDVHCLVKEKEGWVIYLVKIASRLSDRSVRNAAFQYYVLQKEIPIVDVRFALIDRHYERQGAIDPQKLFKIRSVSHRIEKLIPEIDKKVALFRKVLKQEKVPRRKIGNQCTEPLPCDFKSVCWKDVPENSIFELVGLPKDRMFEYWKDGVKKIADIPRDEEISFSQKIQMDGHRRVEKKGVQHFIDSVQYPALFIDFEGYLPSLPPFDGLRPFDLIPFLFAGYLMESPKGKAKLVEFLCTPGQDPRREFCEAFLNAARSAKTLLVYDPLTEQNVLKKLAQTFPEHADEINDIRSRIVDLSLPIRRKDFYLPEMKGYHSMKQVLPAIKPHKHYQDLEIMTGRAAAYMFQVIQENLNHPENENRMNDLKAYCRRDAEGLVHIFRAFEAAAE